MSKQTIFFRNRPEIISAASVVGKTEGQGPLGQWFDIVSDDDTFGESTWEKSESHMLKTAITEAISKSGKKHNDIDVVLCGDLLNQLMSSSFMARDLKLPFIGLYGACSTMTESLLMAAVLTDGGYCNYAVNAASSHFCSAERQFRMPLEHGNQKPIYAQSTVIGAGAMVLTGRKEIFSGTRVCVTEATIGKVVDQGIKDANQMGVQEAGEPKCFLLFVEIDFFGRAGSCPSGAPRLPHRSDGEVRSAGLHDRAGEDVVLHQLFHLSLLFPTPCIWKSVPLAAMLDVKEPRQETRARVYNSGSPLWLPL